MATTMRDGEIDRFAQAPTRSFSPVGETGGRCPKAALVPPTRVDDVLLLQAISKGVYGVADLFLVGRRRRVGPGLCKCGIPQ